MGTEENYVNFSFDVLNSVPTDTGRFTSEYKVAWIPKLICISA